MKRILVRNEKQTEDIAPVFKYTNPGAWTSTTPQLIYDNSHYLKRLAAEFEKTNPPTKFHVNVRY